MKATNAATAQPECPPMMTVDGDSMCPMVQLLDTLAGRWSFPVLYRLIVRDGPMRFGELQREIGRVTQKELTKRLREFERLGLLTRKVYAEVPPRVEYSITEYGRSLRAPLAALAQWSAQSGAPLFQARKKARAAKRLRAVR